MESMYPTSPSTNGMSHRKGIRTSTDQEQGKIEVCSLNFTKIWVLFNYFLKLPEVRWTPEFFTRVLWVSMDEVKLFRREKREVFLVQIIRPVWKFGFSRILYGNWWANKVGWGFLIKKTSVRISWGASVIANNIVYDAGGSDGVSAAILGLKIKT